MKRVIDIFAPRLGLLGGLCIVLAFLWKFPALDFLGVAVGAYLYYHREHHDARRYGTILVFAGIISLFLMLLLR